MATGYKDDLDEKQASDERYNPSGTARDLYNRESDESAFDDIAKNYGDTADDSQENDNIEKAKSKKDPSENIDAAKDAEENPMNSKVTSGGRTQSFDLKTMIQKKGPLGGILMLLGAGGIGISGLLSPALLLQQIADAFTNNFNDANTALHVRTNVHLGKKISTVKNAFAETKDGKCGVKCKMGTMSDTMVRNLKANGYDVVSTQKFGRHVVTQITLPDKTTIIKNGNDFKNAMKDPAKAAHFGRVFNSRTAYFLNSKFGSMLKSKLGINKAYKLAADSKEKFKESFRKAVGLPAVDVNADPNVRPEPIDSPRLAATKATLGKLGGKANVVGAACLAYNVSRAITASVKIAKYAAYASFAMVFLNAAHKLKAADQGGIEPEVMTALGDQLTYTDTRKTIDGKPNELYGLSATDSYGYKAAVYGDSGPLPQYAKNDSMEASGLLGVLAGLAFFATGNKEVRATAHNVCLVGGSDLGTLAQCAPTAPTIIGFIGCVVLNKISGEIIGATIAAAIPNIIKMVIAGNLLTLDENTKGAQAGDALYPGTAAILGGHAASYGMKAGSKAQIKSYAAAGEAVRSQDQAIARIEAKDTPFDVYNQYSFLGSMVRNLNVASYANSGLTKSASILVSTIPRSLASLTANTNAGTYMPVAENKANQYGRTDCPALSTAETGDCCPILKQIGIDGDAYCMPAYTASTEEMNADVDANLDYMIEGKYINEETGEPADTPEGHEFQKFLDHCPFRVDALGETSQAIEAGDTGDYEWYIGSNCSLDTLSKADDVKNFRIYAMGEPVNAAINGEETVLHASSATNEADTSTGSTGTTNENSGNVVKDGWTFPTTANAPLVSPFGPRGGGFHTGIDLGVPSGSPFYATRDGTIQTREYNVFSIAGGSWCPVLGSMTDPNQKDIWITHDVNGTTYTSVYAHMSRYLKKTGDVVKAGDLIGYTGGSGCSSGPHVHFEIWKGPATPSVPGPGMQDPWPLINP